MSDNFKKFFLVQLTEGSFASIPPFVIQKSVQSAVGNVNSIKKLRSGELLIEVFSAKQAGVMSKCTHFASLPVTVKPHLSLNTARGVISESELLNVDVKEIEDNLIKQLVTSAKIITIKRDGKILPKKHIILTFDLPTLPSHIKAGYLRCSVRPYIPNPLRCFKCQRFGHSKDSCRGFVTCARCAQSGHDSDQCSAEFSCVNCKGNHRAYSRVCPKWNFEKEIQTLKTTEKISYPEARNKIQSRTPTPGLSYSAAATSKLKSVGTQTRSMGTQTSDECLSAYSITQKPISKAQISSPSKYFQNF